MGIRCYVAISQGASLSEPYTSELAGGTSVIIIQHFIVVMDVLTPHTHAQQR